MGGRELILEYVYGKILNMAHVTRNTENFVVQDIGPLNPDDESFQMNNFLEKISQRKRLEESKQRSFLRLFS